MADINDNAKDNEIKDAEADETDEPSPSADKGCVPKDANTDFKEALKKRDAEIAALSEKLSEATQNAKVASELQSSITELKHELETQKIDYELKLAGCISVKAARALLDDYDGDTSKLKADNPWLFKPHTRNEPEPKPQGVPEKAEATLSHWRDLAGLKTDKE
jgi:hypothetical protein